MGKSLIDLERKYVTEKRETDFIRWYEEFLPETCEKFLEIGVRFGASAKMFKEWYGDVEMHLLDPFTLDNITEAECHELGFKTYKGSQSDLDLLRTLPLDFDVISEDGSHHSDEQIITFKELFIANLNPGGLYCLEDLHCCRQSFWWRSVDGYSNTFLGVLENVLDGGQWFSQMFDGRESDYLNQIVDRIELVDDGKHAMAFIWHK